MTLVVAVALAATAGTAAAAPVQRVSNADIAPDCNIVTNTTSAPTGTARGAAAVVDDRQAERGRGYLRLTTNSASDHVSVFAERKRYFGMKLDALNEIALRTLIEHAWDPNNSGAQHQHPDQPEEGRQHLHLIGLGAHLHRPWRGADRGVAAMATRRRARAGGPPAPSPTPERSTSTASRPTLRRSTT